MDNLKNEKDLVKRVQSLEERVKYLESLIMDQSQSHFQSMQTKPYEFDEIIGSITVNDSHLDAILKTNMEALLTCQKNHRNVFIQN
jgi:hypothetical protein